MLRSQQSAAVTACGEPRQSHRCSISVSRTTVKILTTLHKESPTPKPERQSTRGRLDINSIPATSISDLGLAIHGITRTMQIQQ